MKKQNGSILEQITILKENPTAAKIGFCMGGIVPLCTAYTAHFLAPGNRWLWLAVGLGLLFSSLTVYTWAAKAFGGEISALYGFSPKAFGFALFLEAVMTFAGDYVALLPLLSLIAINGVEVAYKLVVGRDIAPAKPVKRKAAPEPVKAPKRAAKAAPAWEGERQQAFQM